MLFRDTIDNYIMESPPNHNVVIDGQSYLYFGGTSYLGLHGNKKVIRAACEATQVLGIHSASSRVRAGTISPVLSAELQAANYFSTESAYYFVTGYLSIWVMLQTLQHQHDVFLIDSGCHFSIADAVKMLNRPVLEFTSCNSKELERTLSLKVGKSSKPLVITDGVFSASGVLAPVDKYLKVLNPYEGSGILIDDAHGFGTIGPSGFGTFDHFGLWSHWVNSGLPSPDSPVKLYTCGTLSKALGGFGGIIPGSKQFIEDIKRGSNFFRAASAPPAPIAAASAKALEILNNKTWLHISLQQNVRYVERSLQEIGLDFLKSPAPIIRVGTEGKYDLKSIHEKLKQEGVFVPYAQSYSGDNESGFLRISIFENHTKKMIDSLCSSMEKYFPIL